MSPMRPIVLIMLIAGLLCIVSGCVAADKSGNANPGWFPTSSGSKTSGSAETPTPTPTYVTIATPYPVTTTTPVGLPTPTYRNPPSSSGTQQYMEIYNSMLSFGWNATALEYDVEHPPMVISYEVFPEMVSREIVVTSDYGDRDKKTITTTSVSDQSWFEITVRNKETGQIIRQEGFGKPYQQWDTTNEFSIFAPGSYHIDLRGGENTRVDLHISVANT